MIGSAPPCGECRAPPHGQPPRGFAGISWINACTNDRLDITKSKVITAKYKGKALKTKSGKDDMCLDYAKRDAEFNQCGKK